MAAYHRKIDSLKLKLQKRPSTIREIEQYQYRIRQIELEIAFNCQL
jgi:hypothetical protein